MAAFLGISLWIALATVVPGLITIAAIYGACVATGTSGLERHLATSGDWVPSAIAITIMILTQSLGILLERILTDRKWLGPEERPRTIPPDIDPRCELEFVLKPYLEYQGIYLLIAQMKESDDAHGHLQRALAQFFLSNNTLVSFAAGLAATLIALGAGGDVHGGLVYLGLMVACLLVTFQVVMIRFEVMAKALWAVHRCRPAAKTSRSLVELE
jgi:hypothetical protein